MTRRSLIWLLLLIIVLVVVVIVLIIVFSPTEDDTMHITSLQGGGVSENIEEYADSFMKINESTQTFVFEVTKDDTVIFSGIGTYTHANGTYTFTFADCFYEGTTHTAYLAEGKTLNYSTIDGQICINDPDGKPYYFS